MTELSMEKATENLNKAKYELDVLVRRNLDRRFSTKFMEALDIYIDSKIEYREVSIKESLSSALVEMERIGNQIDEELKKLL